MKVLFCMITNYELNLQTFPASRIDPRVRLFVLNHKGGDQLSLMQSVPRSTPTGTAPGATASKVTG